MAVDVEKLKAQMTTTIGEVAQLQRQIDTKKEVVNKLEGALWGIEQERGAAPTDTGFSYRSEESHEDEEPGG